MLDRTKFVEEISILLMNLGREDLRVGQVFEILRSKHGDLFNVENKQLMYMLMELVGENK